MNFVGAFVHFLWNCLPRKNQTACEAVQYALHTFLVASLLALLASQAMHTLDVYHHAQQEYRDALALYQHDDCAHYRGPSPALMQECSALGIIIQTWPLSRALIRVTHGWQASLQYAVHAVTEHLQYKIAVVLLALALCSYAFKLFRCTKQKTQKAWNAKRVQETERSFMKMLTDELAAKDDINDLALPLHQQKHQQPPRQLFGGSLVSALMGGSSSSGSSSSSTMTTPLQ